MAVATAQDQVDKKRYRNNTNGWQSVVKLDHLGAQRGTPVAPHAEVWLTDDEATLTARAPADSKDNPFEEQMFMFQDAEGKHVEQPMRPLVLIEDDRYTPGEDDRFVPTAEIDLNALAADLQDTQTALHSHSDRLVPSIKGTSHSESLKAEVLNEGKGSWTEAEDRTEQPKKASLGGSHEPAPAAPQGETPVERVAPPQAPVRAAVGEEHAAHTDSGEETGAAEMPVGAAPEGEYAAHEEIGSPDAPKARAEEEVGS